MLWKQRAALAAFWLAALASPVFGQFEFPTPLEDVRRVVKPTICYAGGDSVWLVDWDGQNNRLWIPRQGDSIWFGGPPSWSPDGKRAAAVAFTPQDGQYSLVILDLETGDAANYRTKFFPHLSFTGPQWSPDGKWIACEGGPLAFNLDVYKVNVETGEATNLTNARMNHDADPTWSPDGKKLAFKSRRKKLDGKFQHDIYVMDADGKNEIRLTNHPAQDGSPRWSPDGKTIVFESYDRSEPAGTNLYLMDPDGSNIRQLTFGPHWEVGPSWSPDGKWILYSSGQTGDGVDLFHGGAWNIYRIHVETKEVIQITHGDHGGLGPEWVLSGGSGRFPMGFIPWGRLKGAAATDR